jgi:hypothetical protein
MPLNHGYRDLKLSQGGCRTVLCREVDIEIAGLL